MYAKIINNETNEVLVGTDTNVEFYKSIGMTEMDVEQAWDGVWYVKGFAPKKPVPTHGEIRLMRQSRYVAEADPIKLDYDEAVARGDAKADEYKILWLAKKDEIRADLPYPDETTGE